MLVEEKKYPIFADQEWSDDSGKDPKEEGDAESNVDPDDKDGDDEEEEDDDDDGDEVEGDDQ